MTDDDEREMKQELLAMDLQLRRKQVGWETPRNIAILFAAMAALLTGLVGAAGFIGFRIGQSAPTPPIIINIPAPK